MSIRVRYALALALSLAAAGMAQQAIMALDGVRDTLFALLPLGILILLLSVIFGIVLWRSRNASAFGWTALALLVVMLIVGVIAYHLGVASKSPGVGGNIGYGLALILDEYFLPPAALAVAIHWLLLRGVTRA